MAKWKAPSGFRDFLPQACRKRALLMRRIREVYESFGFEPMETPAMEKLDLFAGKGGGENEKLMFKVLRRGDDLGRKFDNLRNAANKAGGIREPTSISLKNLADLGLRFDLTVPLARFYATHRGELPPVFKRYQIGPVWRAERAQRGRYREFIQCDVDVLGSASMMVEAEVIQATATALARLGFSGLTVRLNSRPLLAKIVEWIGIPPEHISRVITWIDKLDKPEADWHGAELVKAGIPDNLVVKLILVYVPSYKGGETQKELFAAMRKQLEEVPNEKRLDILQRQLGGASNAYIQQIREILALTPEFPSGKLIFDPSLARGLDYYTGAIFEVAAPGVPFSLAGGGRFDGLIGKLGGAEVPACGFSIGFERIRALMEERGMFAESPSAADVLIAAGRPEDAAAAMEIASALRSAGLRADLFPGQAKRARQYEVAERKGIPFAVLLETEALAAGRVTLRDLAARQSATLPREVLADELKERLARAQPGGGGTPA